MQQYLCNTCISNSSLKSIASEHIHYSTILWAQCVLPDTQTKLFTCLWYREVFHNQTARMHLLYHEVLCVECLCKEDEVSHCTKQKFWEVKQLGITWTPTKLFIFRFSNMLWKYLLWSGVTVKLCNVSGKVNSWWKYLWLRSFLIKCSYISEHIMFLKVQNQRYCKTFLYVGIFVFVLMHTGRKATLFLSFFWYLIV